MLFFFASDLHGRPGRWQALFRCIEAERPAAVLLGGDLGPHPFAANPAPPGTGFLDGWVGPQLADLRARLGGDYPRVLAILGNDDPAVLVEDLEDLERQGLLEHVHKRRVEVTGVPVYGCAWVPPSPFQFKDWERYDVGRGVDPGCVSPEEGSRSVDVPAGEIRWSTIAGELSELTGDDDLAEAVMLFHAPPHDTALDRAALDGKFIDHVPLDVHVGSIAIRRFLEQRRPAVALCGHIHESARLTGAWRDTVGATAVLGAAHDGPELALVRFDPREPEQATRELLPAPD